MQIHGFNKTTLLDYPGHLAATLFTGACNFRCPFCQNASLVLYPDSQPLIPEEDILAYLDKRRGILEGVCITGGEPSLQPDLPDFIRRVREKGLLVKLDTNGGSPGMLKTLLDEGLISYVAMDIKSSPEHYPDAAGVPELHFDSVAESVRLIMESGVPYEFRTTAVKELISEEDFRSIGKWLDGAARYYLQSFRDSGDLVGNMTLTGYSKDELLYLTELLRPHFGEVGVRGVD